MSATDVTSEWGVEVPGRGYVITVLPSIIVELGDDPYTGTASREDAEAGLRRAKHAYTTMGCSEIADTVRLISRTVTVVRGDWHPIDSPSGLGDNAIPEENTEKETKK